MRKGVKKENKKGVYGGFAPVWRKRGSLREGALPP